MADDDPRMVGSCFPPDVPDAVADALGHLATATQVRADHGSDPLQTWAASGAMWLSGRPDGAPVVAPGGPARLVATGLSRLAAARAAVGLPGPELLGERASIIGLRRHGSTSCGGRTRLLAARDGHVAVSLARADDVDLVPALISAAVSGDPERELAAWVAETPTAEVAERAQLLGIAAAAVPLPTDPPDEQAASRGGRAGATPVVVTPGGPRRGAPRRPLIVDLSSLWAGPLATRLLGLLGAAVVKVESPSRLDGARQGSSDFYDLLHGGHQSVTVDLSTADGVGRLNSLLARADLVIEASRPRALLQLGVEAREYVDRGTVWLSITAYGRTGPWSNRVGFGDDVAAAAGMVGRLDGEPCFLGDALADPMAGVVAALVAHAALRGDRGLLLDVSMRDVVASTLGDVPPHEVSQSRDGGWWVTGEHGRFMVAPPRSRPAARRAPAPGAHNERWFGSA